MCQFGSVKIPGGPEGGIVENSHNPPPSSHEIGSGKLVCDKKISSRQTECIGVIYKDVWTSVGAFGAISK